VVILVQTVVNAKFHKDGGQAARAAAGSISKNMLV